MDFGITTAKIDEVGYIVHAENLGFTHCWVTDSQMIRSHPFAVLAVAAMQTRTIKLGVGVAIPGLRLAPVTANGIATINRLAPGRCFIGLGTGHTAMRTIGQRPMRLAPFAEYIKVVRGLIRGEAVDYTLGGETHRIAFGAREFRYVDVEHPIPLYVAGYGPKAQALAGELGDGLVTGIPRGGTVAEALANARAGAARVGRTLDAGFYLAERVSLCMLEPGEDLMSDRVLEDAGPAVMTGMHYLVSRYLEVGAEPPSYAETAWKPYLAYIQGLPEAERHTRLHDSHYTKLSPEEARFITPELIRGTCLAGQPEEIVEQLQEMERQGCHQVGLNLPIGRMYRIIEDFADRVMARL